MNTRHLEDFHLNQPNVMVKSLPPGPSAFLEWVDRFLAHLSLERGLSVHTISAYEQDLKQAIAHFSTQYTGWHDVYLSDLNGWLQTCGQKNYSKTSLARKRSSIRTFFQFLVQEGLRSDNPTILLEGPKIKRQLPITVSEASIVDLLTAPRLDHPQGLRDRAILELIYSSGLRASEVCNLLLTDLFLDEGYVRVLGKGSKERLVPMGQAAITMITNYLATGRPAFVTSQTGSAVFLSERGLPLSRKTLWHWVKHYSKQAGLPKAMKPHALRHAFATHLLAHGADLRSIQEMLGHADIATTQIYTAVQTDTLEKEHALFHPRR